MRWPYRFDWRGFIAVNALFGVALVVWILVGLW
jgi:hypothetical protein